MEQVGYYNMSELVERVRAVGLEILQRREATLVAVSAEQAEQFVKFWVRMSVGLSDYAIFTPGAVATIHREYFLQADSTNIVTTVLGAFAELRARVFNNDTDWDNFVRQLAVSYTAVNDQMSIFAKTVVSNLGVEDTCVATIKSNPWIVIIWIMATNVASIRGGKATRG